MLSPVWIPIGSKFSIEQIIMTLSFLSLTTSNSYSFQPTIDSSIWTSDTGDESRADFNNDSKSFSL